MVCGPHTVTILCRIVGNFILSLSKVTSSCCLFSYLCIFSPLHNDGIPAPLPFEFLVCLLVDLLRRHFAVLSFGGRGLEVPGDVGVGESPDLGRQLGLVTWTRLELTKILDLGCKLNLKRRLEQPTEKYG